MNNIKELTKTVMKFLVSIISLCRSFKPVTMLTLNTRYHILWC